MMKEAKLETYRQIAIAVALSALHLPRVSIITSSSTITTASYIIHHHHHHHHDHHHHHHSRFQQTSTVQFRNYFPNLPKPLPLLSI